MSTSTPMPRYTSHKIVSALKIAAIASLPNDGPVRSYGATITPAEVGFEPFEVPADYVTRHRPQEGGYFVVYADGYTSYSPAEAFESGYTPVVGPRVIDPGHRYRLSGAQVLQFMKKERHPVGGFVYQSADGTTNEELLDVLIDRIRTLNAAFSCRENSLAITKLEEAKHWLEARTRDRQARGVEGQLTA